MIYATLEDYITRWGSEGLPQRANEAGELEADAGRIEAALIDASALIDSHLQKRFQTPFEPVPPLIQALALDVARFRLSADVLESSSPAKILYKEALSTLNGTSSGQMRLDAPLAEGADAAEGAFFESQAPQWNHKQL